MKTSPFARLCLLLVFSPLVPWAVMWVVPSSVESSGSWVTNTFAFTAYAWMTMIAITAAILLAIAACLGLLRVGPMMTIAVLMGAICVPVAFMLMGFWSLVAPLGAYLGAFPAFVIATLDKSDRMVGRPRS